MNDTRMVGPCLLCRRAMDWLVVVAPDWPAACRHCLGYVSQLLPRNKQYAAYLLALADANAIQRGEFTEPPFLSLLAAVA